MCQQTFQRPNKYFGTSLSDDSGLYNSIAYAVLQNIEIFTTANVPFWRGQIFLIFICFPTSIEIRVGDSVDQVIKKA